jgi:hypothetical protein
MADFVLLCLTQLSEGAPERRKIKYWIIAESCLATRLFGYYTFCSIREEREHFSSPGRCNHADKPRSACLARHPAHFREKLRNALRIARHRPGISCRLHSWFAAQRGNDEPGIIGKDDFFGASAIVEGFACRVFRERGRILGECREFLESLERIDSNSARRAHRAVLTKLPHVRRGEQQPSGRVHGSPCAIIPVVLR